MSNEHSPSGMQGARLPQRLPGAQLRWFGTLPEPVNSPPAERPTRARRGDAVAFVEASRRLRMGVAS